MPERSVTCRQYTAQACAAMPEYSRGPQALLVACAAALVLAGCAQFRPHVPPSQGHITAPEVKAQPTAAAIPPPARVTPLVPPPTAQIKPQTYSVVVNEVPVKELLLALARDTKQNIDIHPGLTGPVSLNAINETLPAILERISKQINLRYRTEGNTIVVSPDTAYMKTYLVNYVNMDRKTTSTISASGQIGSGSAGGGTTNASSTSVTTNSNSDFWTTLEKAVKAILTSSLYQRQKVAEIADSIIKKQEQDFRAKQIEATTAGKAVAAAPTVTSASPTPVVSVQPEDVIVNAVSGTITVNGNDQQHQLVQDYLTKVERGSQRQVLIEATIVEVVLSDAYQGGIDWSRVAIGGGFTFTQALLGGFGNAALAAGATPGNAMTVGYQQTSPNRTINVTLKLLQEFGNTRVLSSPKLMTLNNQTALLKAVDNLVYFEVQATAGTSTVAGVVGQPTFNTTAKTVAVGVVMGLTPQVSEDGRVLLTVRPTITRLSPGREFVDDPNPSLKNPCGQPTPCTDQAVTNRVPQIQTREMESVLQVGSGQIVILGGLMQDDVQRNREQIPGADQLGEAGELFRFRNERATKTELVIFIRPTIVSNPSLDSDELKFFQRFLPQAQTATPPTAQPAKP